MTVSFKQIKGVVLDIEGTTCPVDFVSGQLFPYARRALPAYLAEHGQDPELAPLLAEVRQAMVSESDGAAPRELVAYLQWLIDQDRKFTPLKDLQGRLWRQGYAEGALQARLFSDVVPALRRWHGQGLLLAVYSSGSVAAQQLLYGHSSEGDLRNLFSGWFDTRLGPKRESHSYERLAEALVTPAAELLFISDVAAELNAAAAAGFQVCGSQRPGNPEQLLGPWPVLESFEALAPFDIAA